MLHIVHMIQRRIAVDPAAFPRRRGDAAIERLSELGHDERPVPRRVTNRSDRIGGRAMMGARRTGGRHAFRSRPFAACSLQRQRCYRPT